MNLDANVNNQIFRKDYPQVIAKNRHLASLAACRLLPTGNNAYPAGLVLAARIDGFFVPYVNGGASGTGTAVAVLNETIQDDGTYPTLMGRGIFAGELFYAALIGVDSNAVSNLNARTYTASDGNEILKF